MNKEELKSLETIAKLQYQLLPSKYCFEFESFKQGYITAYATFGNQLTLKDAYRQALAQLELLEKKKEHIGGV